MARAASRAGARRGARRRTCRWTGAAARSSPASGPRPRSRCARAARRSSRRGRARSSSRRSRGRTPPCAAARASGASSPRPGTSGPRSAASGASRCSPIVFSPISRTSLLRSVQLASGATGVPARPAQVGRAMIRSRSLKPVLLLEPRARLRVDLGDVDALRADLRADPAARAVVDGRVGRRLVGDPEALGLRPGVLRAREQRRDVRDRAVRLADRALHAMVERVAHVQRVEQVTGLRHAPCRSAPAAAAARRSSSPAASTSSAARCPVARLMPSPDFSFQGSAPASVAPATSTLPSRRSPARVDGAQLVVDRHARARQRVRAEVLGVEARLARLRHPRHRQPERHLARHPVRAQLDAAGGEAAAREHDPVRAAALLAQPDPDAHRGDPVALASRRRPRCCSGSASRPRAAAPRAGSRTRACPGTDGGSVGISNTGRPSERSSSVQTACGSAIPSTAGSATRSPLRSRRPLSCPISVAAEGGVVEPARHRRAR